MSRLPGILEEGRGPRVAGLALLALGQAAGAGMAAVGVREVFSAMAGDGNPLPLPALAAIAAAGGVIALLRWGERVAAERLGQDYAAAVRLRVFSHVAGLPLSELSKRRSGSLSLRFVGDLTAVRGWVSQGLVRLLSAAIVMVVVAGVLLSLDRAMGLAAVASVGAGLLGMLLVGSGLPRAHRQLRRRRAALAGDVAERLPHGPELRLLGRLALERRRLAGRSRRLVAAAVRRQRRAALLRAIPELVQGAAAALVLWMALTAGAATASAAAALAALALLIQPLRDLAGVWDRYAAWVAARRRCERLLQTPRLRPRGRRGAGGRPAGPPRLEFRGVQAGVVRELSAVLEPGRKIGITGPNGAGKSTLLHLAAGLEAAGAGRVLLAGRPPTELDGRARRSLLVYAGPRSPILAGSLRRALTLGHRRRASDQAVAAAAAHYGLQPLIDRLGGLQGRVAEAGKNLSAGEIRRVLLARAALAAAPLLLLDEPDDALDRDSRHLVTDLVRSTGASVLLVSHDWATLSTMDEIWFMERGRLVEVSSPAAARCGDGPIARFFGLHHAA